LTKPFNPYLRRHIGITEKARQIPEHSLRLYSGWTKTSKMPEVYTHELGNEISNQILELEGYSTRSIESNVLKSRICPNCQEPNKPETKFCAKCRMVLSYDAYTQVTQHNEEFEQTRFEKLEAKIDALAHHFWKNNVRKGTPNQDPEHDWEEMIPMTVEEIEQELSMRRERARRRHMREKKLWQELND